MCKKFWFPFSLSVFVCMCLSNANASICFLPDCQDKGIMNGDINMDINNATRWCEKKGFTYYSSGQCPEYYKKVETCKRDSNYLKCDAQAWCKDNGYNTTTCSLPNFIDQQCPNGLPLYKGCKEDTARACKQIGYTNTCPSGQKLKANTGRCSWNNAYGTCCSPSACPAYTSLTVSSYGTNGTDGCEYACYYTCNINCPSSYPYTSDPTGCSLRTTNGCGNKSCYQSKSCCTPSCSSEWGCSCGTYTSNDGCGGTCTRCSACTPPRCTGPANGLVVYPCQNFGCTSSSGKTGWKYDGQYYTYGSGCETSFQSRFQYSGCDDSLSACMSRRGFSHNEDGYPWN